MKKILASLMLMLIACGGINAQTTYNMKKGKTKQEVNHRVSAAPTNHRVSTRPTPVTVKTKTKTVVQKPAYGHKRGVAAKRGKVVKKKTVHRKMIRPEEDIFMPTPVPSSAPAEVQKYNINQEAGSPTTVEIREGNVSVNGEQIATITNLQRDCIRVTINKPESAAAETTQKSSCCGEKHEDACGTCGHAHYYYGSCHSWRKYMRHHYCW